MPDLTGCPSQEASRTIIPLIGGTNKQNYDLLKNKYIKISSRVCEQYALLSGCGCNVSNEVGFVLPAFTPNRTNPTLRNCPTKGAAKPSDINCA